MPKTKVAIAAQSGEIHWSQRPLLHIRVAAELLGVSRSSIYRLEAAGHLAFGRIGGRTVVRTDSLLRYLESVEAWTASEAGSAGRRVQIERAAAEWQS